MGCWWWWWLMDQISEALLYNQNQVVVVYHPHAKFLKKLYNLVQTI
jgi:hypothetical protein